MILRAFVAAHRRKTGWSASEKSSGSSIYPWLARATLNSKAQHELSARQNKAEQFLTLKRNKQGFELASELDLANEIIDNWQIKCTQNHISVIRMLKEIDRGHQAYAEATRFKITCGHATSTKNGVELISYGTVATQKHTLKNFTYHIPNIIFKRAYVGYKYGITVIPEGLIDFLERYAVRQKQKLQQQEWAETIDPSKLLLGNVIGRGTFVSMEVCKNDFEKKLVYGRFLYHSNGNQEIVVELQTFYMNKLEWGLWIFGSGGSKQKAILAINAIDIPSDIYKELRPSIPLDCPRSLANLMEQCVTLIQVMGDRCGAACCGSRKWRGRPVIECLWDNTRHLPEIDQVALMTLNEFYRLVVAPLDTTAPQYLCKIVTNRFTLIVLSALRRSDKENRQVGPHGSRGSSKDGDGDTSFQWSQFTTPCSHLMFLINDIMTTERPTTQLPQL
ncbi:hypothetical protein Tco_0017591 [Tanacetum coccineum]